MNIWICDAAKIPVIMRTRSAGAGHVVQELRALTSPLTTAKFATLACDSFSRTPHIHSHVLLSLQYNG